MVAPASTNISISNVEKIESYAFEGCTGLTNIAIPSSVTNISGVAFNGCSNIITITVDKPVGSISGAPWGAKNATVVWANEEVEANEAN